MRRKTLIAGVGNVFLGDDGFGVAVAGRLAGAALGDGVTVRDIGIRARDLAYELLDGGYETAILVDAVARGEQPGTVSLIQPEGPAAGRGPAEVPVDAHAMTPDTVLAFLDGLRGVSTRIWIVGCEPASVEEGMGLSPPVTAAIDEAIVMIRQLLKQAGDATYEHGGTPVGSPDACA